MVLLTFDIEEFDMPLEYGADLPFEKQLEYSREGCQAVLSLLRKYNFKATFFSTAVFARHHEDLIRDLIREGHELASHTYSHSSFKTEDLRVSKTFMEGLFGVEINGLRMPRMRQVPDQDVLDAGYKYNSSINPTWLPGRCNNLSLPRLPFERNTLLHIPVSVTRRLRIPLFWLSFHNFPLALYQYLSKKLIEGTGLLHLYFHPWEFCDIGAKELQLPFFVKKNTGSKMIKRFDLFLSWLERNAYEGTSIQNYLTRNSLWANQNESL